MNRIESRGAVVIAAVAAFSMLAMSAGAAARSGDKSNLDPKAMKLLHESLDSLHKLQSFHVDVERAVEMKQFKKSDKVSVRIDVKKPAKLAVASASTTTGTSLFTDGTTLTVFDVAQNTYLRQKAPETLEKLPESMAQIRMGQDCLGIAMPLLLSGLEAGITDGATTAAFAEKQKLDGKSCSHIKIASPNMDADIWIADHGKPLLMKLQVEQDMRLNLRSPLPAGFKMPRQTFTLKLSNWEPEAKISDDKFAFKLPPGATETKGAVGNGEPPPALPVGSPAPPFTLDLLEGGKVNLADLLGKKVIILDFWATWCGPCRMGLPLVVQTALAYKDKGVVCFAVNKREPAETVRKFIADQNLTVSVALDSANMVSDKYGVSGIPHTFVIGRDGKIAAFHLGYRPDLKDVLSKEIDEALAKSPGK